MVSKTTQMLREKLGAFEGYAEGRGWGWCSCPRGWHKEVYFTEAETEGIRKRCRRRTDSDYGTTGGGAEFVEEYDVKSGLGYSNWLGVVVDQGEVVYPVLGAFGGWGNGVVLNGAELV